MQKFNRWLSALCAVLLWLVLGTFAGADEPTHADVNTVLTKYCAGCHNADDANGEFAVDTFAALAKGGENGTAITPGSAASSRLVQMMRGALEPVMPPEGEPAPTDDEIQLIADWIDHGAPGPAGTSLPTTLVTPELETKATYQPVTALALSSDAQTLAVARFGKIELRDGDATRILKTLADLPGKITSLAFLNRDRWLMVGTGVTGLYGEAVLIDVANGQIVRRYRGHRDLVYSIAVSPDQQWFATAGYDKKSVLWNVESDQPIREFTGHNDAVFENVFDPTGERLVTASADATVKVWRVSDAKRLDTRGEPLMEQYTAAISPDGNWMVAGGEDNRIRKWRLLPLESNQTNPLEIARFAHESAIQLLRFHADGEHLVSIATDGAIKIWDAETLTQVHEFENPTQGVQSIALAPDRVVVGRLDGSLDVLPWPGKDLMDPTNDSRERPISVASSDAIAEAPKSSVSLEEIEPNNTASEANSAEIPFKLSGVIESESDVDFVRFQATRGQRLIVTAQSDSPNTVDTHVAVLDAQGQPVPRVLLRAVRDSYFTFRGKDSIQTSDFRVHNWEEMKLNQFLYCNGEVVKLFHYPRGPDSGFNVYPNFGKRHGMFDTTPITHALHEPCFIVEPHPPGTEFPATGLPQFLLNYENDDDAQQELGANSRLTFVVPETGEYMVRVRDVRDFGGQDFSYKLEVRPEAPGFSIQGIIGENPTLLRDAYKRIGITIDRVDNFAGPIDIELIDLPAGITSRGPITVEENGLQAFFTLHVSKNASEPTPETIAPSVVARALIQGNEVRQTKSLGKIKIASPPKLAVQLNHAPQQMPHYDSNGLPVLEIRPGETITAEVSVTRRGHDQRVNFGKENAAVNVPFGVYIDNIGLNGVLIPPDQNSRTFFLTAESWVKPCSRLIFLEAEEAGKPASNPAVLRVLPPRRPSEPSDDR